MDLYKYTVLGLLILLSTTDAYSVAQGDTLMDDEDNFNKEQKGTFTLKMRTQLQCADWSTLKNADHTMRTNIRKAVVEAVSHNCSCNFTTKHITVKDVDCNAYVGDIMYYTGEIRSVNEPERHNVTSLLQLVEVWAHGGPVIEVSTQVIGAVQVVLRITVLQVTTHLTDLEDGSGFSGDEGISDTEPEPIAGTVETTTVSDIESTTEHPTSSSQSTAASLMIVLFVLICSIALNIKT